MSLLPPVGWADVATKTDLHAVQADVRAVQTELSAVEGTFRADMRAMEVNLRADMGAMESNLRGEVAQVDTKIDLMASTLRVELHQSIRNQTWALVAWTTALAGMIVALGR